ncbi:MAG: hypothetical protein EAZ16_11090 [Sphingobacteriales bacterium]|nr:MAG: hypothetical protein EAZ16_11090 [Sphingobacteriales bacterium]
MNELLVQKAATQFGNEPTAIKALGSGLIHHTYCVHYKNSPAMVLQAINKNTFKKPENIIQNYCMVQNYLSNAENSNAIAGLVTSKNGSYFWEDEAENFWRATLYFENSYALKMPTAPHKPRLLQIVLPHLQNNSAGLIQINYMRSFRAFITWRTVTSNLKMLLKELLSSG